MFLTSDELKIKQANEQQVTPVVDALETVTN
jgi:hypothetical protein